MRITKKKNELLVYWFQRFIIRKSNNVYNELFTHKTEPKKRYIISTTVKPTFPSQRHFIHPLILKPLLIIHETFKIIIFHNPRDFPTANLSMFTFCVVLFCVWELPPQKTFYYQLVFHVIFHNILKRKVVVQLCNSNCDKVYKIPFQLTKNDLINHITLVVVVVFWLCYME